MLQEGQQLRHYRIAGLLKSGGMGEVYLAVDTLLHRQVAIKVIQSDAFRYTETDTAREAVRLFLREAQAIARRSIGQRRKKFGSRPRNAILVALRRVVPATDKNKGGSRRRRFLHDARLHYRVAGLEIFFDGLRQLGSRFGQGV